MLLKRGRDISRLEAFSDAVFGFSATLLVVSLEVPRTFPALMEDLKGFVSFGLSFGALILLWSVHNGFFRRYGLQDNWTVALNSIFLFVVLFYVYPLKYMAGSLGSLGRSGDYRLATLDDLASLFIVYGLAFAALFLCISLMYLHAWRSRERLVLDDDETYEAAFLFRHYLIFSAMGFMSVLMALAGIGLMVGLPGWMYALLGPLCYTHAMWSLRRRRRVDAIAREEPELSGEVTETPTGP